MKILERMTDAELLAEWEAAKAEGHNQAEFARTINAPLTRFIPRLYRALHGFSHAPFEVALPTRWELNWPSFMVVGDVHCPTTDYDLATCVAMVAKKQLKRPRRLLIAGDFMNFDAWSTYPAMLTPPAWQQEKEAARTLLLLWLDVFDEIRWLFGNHERRRLYAAMGEEEENDILAVLRVPDKRILVSLYDRCTVDTLAGTWSVIHGGNYGQNPLVVANVYAQKLHTHVISGHEHHAALGMDIYDRYMLCNLGGLFDAHKMAYVETVTRRGAGMSQGFVMLRDGLPTLFSPKITDWQRWL